MTLQKCCEMSCTKDAEWEIHTHTPYSETLACTEHVGELLSDAPEHRIFPVGNKP